MIPARRIAALLLVAVTALVLAACGSSDSGPSSAQDVLKETFGPDKPVHSGKLDLALALNATGLQGVNGPVKITLKGPFQSQGGKTLPAFDFDLGLTSGGTSFTAGAVSTGKAGYLKFQGTPYALTAALYESFKKGYEQSAKASGSKSSGPSFRSLGVDPLRWLSDPQTVGTETVGGTETRHVSATVDVPKLLADVNTLLSKADKLGGAAGAAAGVPKGLTAAQRQQLQDAVKSATFDVWSGKDDGTLRKLDIKVAFAVPKASQAKAGGLKDGTLEIVLLISDLNKKQTITGPTGAKPLAQLQSQLGGLLGGASGTTGSTGTGDTTATAPTTTTPTTTAPATAYVQCLQAAGADIAKVNDCAKLRGQ